MNTPVPLPPPEPERGAAGALVAPAAAGRAGGCGGCWGGEAGHRNRDPLLVLLLVTGAAAVYGDAGWVIEPGGDDDLWSLWKGAGKQR